MYTAYTHEHTIPAQRSVHPVYTHSSQRGLYAYILYALALLRLIHSGSTCPGSHVLVCPLILSTASGHTLAHTGRPTESSVISRCLFGSPTHIRLHHIKLHSGVYCTISTVLSTSPLQNSQHTQTAQPACSITHAPTPSLSIYQLDSLESVAVVCGADVTSFTVISALLYHTNCITIGFHQCARPMIR